MSLYSKIIRLSSEIYFEDNLNILIDYLAHRDFLPPQVDLIMILGSKDLAIPEYASLIFKNGVGKNIITCGGVGRLSGNLNAPEAIIYNNILLSNGIPQSKISIESSSTNTEENIKFGIKLAQQNLIPYQSVLLMQTPLIQRRAGLTFKKHYPEITLFNYAAYKPVVTKQNYSELKNLATGEMQRLLTYGPEGKNFIVEPHITTKALTAYQNLIQH
ncbi:MAG: YdcF family protein, partial [Candidatus Margulisbacteria bacterium]|nr:YdcF family protein [Candidatus Margulisiibacteriota bacterium]